MKQVFVTLLLSLASLSSVIGSEQSKPNIIFILIDDLGKEWVNCYGGEGIDTPNVDALAPLTRASESASTY